MSLYFASMSNTGMLFDRTGNRKYLTAGEWNAFVASAKQFTPEVETFCTTLAHTGARIPEALALTPARIDRQAGTIAIECLKRRERGIYRVVPVPERLFERLEDVHAISFSRNDGQLCRNRIWSWCRTTAWQRIKEVMDRANISNTSAMPKALRHAFGVEGTTEAGVPLNMMQKWMGQARIETTAIYANAVGAEERALAARMWVPTKTTGLDPQQRHPQRRGSPRATIF